MVRVKLVPKKINVVRAPGRQFTRYKIKTLLPEERAIVMKKNGQVIKTIKVRRKTSIFTDRWARNF